MWSWTSPYGKLLIAIAAVRKDTLVYSEMLIIKLKGNFLCQTNLIYIIYTCTYIIQNKYASLKLLHMNKIMT